MSRFRTHIVGRDRQCDVRLDDSSVSRRHAEVVPLSGGRLYVTDRATTNGTLILDGGDWQKIRQAILDPAGRVRFGDHEMSAGQLGALCQRHDARPSHRIHRTGPSPTPPPPKPPPPEEGELDPSKGLVRDPKTGEILEQG